MRRSACGSIDQRRVGSPVKVGGVWRAGLGMGALLWLCAGSVSAQQIHVTVNGSPVEFVGLGPLQVQGRTLVPVRGVLEKLGAEVAWVPSTRSVVASTPTMDIELHLGDRQATVNGKQVTLDVPAQEIEGHTMVPLRFLGEALGSTVKWDDVSRTVTIVTQDGGGDQAGADRPRRDRNRDRDRAGGEGDRPSRNPGSASRPGAEPKIVSLGFKADDWYGWVQPGHSVRIEMNGTPGGEALFRIPGLTDALPMKEVQPGRYVATWTVPTNHELQLKDASVLAELKVGNKSAPAVQAEGRLSVDSKPPTILDRLPEPDARVNSTRPNISAVFEDQGSGIWPPSIRLLVNGRDVSKEARITNNFVSYTPTEPLPPGETHIVLAINDKATNEARTEWNIDVLAGDNGSGIRSVKDNVGKTLEPGDVLHVEMDGVRGGVATFSLGNIKEVRMAEGPAGHYAADYTIRKGDDVRNATLATHLTLPDGQKFIRQAERAITVTTGKPTPPVILSPNKNDPIESPLVIRGKATPHTQIRVKVDYSSKVLGLVPVQGTAADTIVTADRDGNWRTEPIDARNLLANRGVEYTVSATAISANEEKSDTTEYRFRLR